MTARMFWAYTIKTLLIILAYGIIFWGNAARLCGADPQLTYWQALLTTHIIMIGPGLNIREYQALDTPILI
jgi:hypothetical protein